MGAKRLGYGGAKRLGLKIEAKRLGGKRLGGNVLGSKRLVTRRYMCGFAAFRDTIHME